MKNRLHVIDEIINSSLEEVIEKYSLRTNIYGNFIQLNYNQIDSPKNEVTNECRGLILDISQPIPIVAAYPFRRFFNYGETQADDVEFEGKYTRYFNKLDGSIILCWYNIYKNKIMFSTRGSILANGNVGYNNFTFAELIEGTIKENDYYFKDMHKNTNINLVFELTSPYNKIVTYYNKPELTLLAARNIETFEEYDLSMLNYIATQINCKTPKIYNINNVYDAQKMLNEIKPTDEGFVVVDYSQSINGSYKRVKIKNPRYLAISKLVNAGGEMTDERFVDIVKLGEIDEVCTYYPEYKQKLLDIQQKMDIIIDRVDKDYKLIVVGNKGNRKEFALKAKETICPAALFAMLDGKIKSAKEFVYNMKSDKIIELLGAKHDYEQNIS